MAASSNSTGPAHDGKARDRRADAVWSAVLHFTPQPSWLFLRRMTLPSCNGDYVELQRRPVLLLFPSQRAGLVDVDCKRLLHVMNAIWLEQQP